MITVLITTHNYGKFIEEALDSVLAQEMPTQELEIVVVDDGSTDDTAERLKKYKGRVQYFYKENGGQASALNLGFAKSHGDLVALLDADDLFLPRKLSLIERAFEQDSALGLVYHPCFEWNVKTNERRLSNFSLVSGDIRLEPKKFSSHFAHPTSCLAFRRSAINRLLPIPEKIRMLADAYPANLMPFVAPVMALTEPLVVYRVHGENSYFTDASMPLKIRKKRYRQWQTVILSMRRWLVNNGWSSKKEPAVRDFLQRWDQHQKAERLIISPVGRFKFVHSLLRSNYKAQGLQTFAFTTFNYLTAFVGVFFGFRRESQFHKWRLVALERIRQRLQRISPNRSRVSSITQPHDPLK
jgi:glycosyltransferase involved in cell wall biosynthesis